MVLYLYKWHFNHTITFYTLNVSLLSRERFQMIKICLQCGKQYETKEKSSKYCSWECVIRMRYDVRLKRMRGELRREYKGEL
jgi:hypothetical protein